MSKTKCRFYSEILKETSDGWGGLRPTPPPYGPHKKLPSFPYRSLCLPGVYGPGLHKGVRGRYPPTDCLALGGVSPPTGCPPSLERGKGERGPFPYREKGAGGHETGEVEKKEKAYKLETFHRSNQDTCLTHKPVVSPGDWVQSGDLLTDCASSVGGELALGQNIMIAYMPWEGYNFEDAILISERLVIDDLFTSVHIERYEMAGPGLLDGNKKEEGGDNLEGEERTRLGSRIDGGGVSRNADRYKGNIEITRDIPDVNEKEIEHLDSFGIIKKGSWVEEGDILIGKRAPISKKQISPYQKLLYTILNKQIQSYRDCSLRAPKGIKAKVLSIKYFKKSTYNRYKETLAKRTMVYRGEEKSRRPPTPTLGGRLAKRKKRGGAGMQGQRSVGAPFYIKGGRFYSAAGPRGSTRPADRKIAKRRRLKDKRSRHKGGSRSVLKRMNKLFLPPLHKSKRRDYSLGSFPFISSPLGGRGKGGPFLGHSRTPPIKKSPLKGGAVKDNRPSPSIISFLKKGRKANKENKEDKDKKERMTGGPEGAPPFFREPDPPTIGLSSVETIHIYLAEKRKIQVGDKMAGRHGNKGIVSKILPIEDMPFLPDGTPVDMVLNPLGVPSRMNVGQIYECLLGLAGKYLGENYKVYSFDEIYGANASRSFVFNKLYTARRKTGFSWLFSPNIPGKTRLYDGRTGDCFIQPITVGQAYMLRLVHMVDDKIHMRSTGPYSLVTQQPLRGRSKQGGQRLGEMEVWAIEGSGAAFTLLEMLTIKSDDLTGRMTLWSNLILNKDLSIGTPEAFKVLVCELQALCLDIGLFRKGKPISSSFSSLNEKRKGEDRGKDPQPSQSRSAPPRLIEIPNLTFFP